MLPELSRKSPEFKSSCPIAINKCQVVSIDINKTPVQLRETSWSEDLYMSTSSTSAWEAVAYLAFLTAPSPPRKISAHHWNSKKAKTKNVLNYVPSLLLQTSCTVSRFFHVHGNGPLLTSFSFSSTCAVPATRFYIDTLQMILRT